MDVHSGRGIAWPPRPAQRQSEPAGPDYTITFPAAGEDDARASVRVAEGRAREERRGAMLTRGEKLRRVQVTRPAL